MECTVKFKTRHVGGHGKSAGDVWTAKILPNRIIYQKQLAAMLAETGGFPAETIQYLLTHMWLKIIALLQEGCNVYLEGVRFSLQATGTLPYANSEFDPERNRVVARATINEMLRDAPRTKKGPAGSRAKAPLLKPINTLPRHTGKDISNISSVTDDKSWLVDVVTSPSRILVAGIDLLITPGQPDEGVQFVSHKDGSVYVPQITANTIDTIDLKLDELPPPGEYTLLVRSRSGASLSLAPNEARHVIIIDPNRKDHKFGKRRGRPKRR